MKEETQMSLWEDSHANLSQSQVKEKVQEMIATSGQKCYELSKHRNQDGLLAKMSGILLQSKTAWYSNKCVLTWKTKATKSNRLLFQLAVCKHPIEEIESGSSEGQYKMWPTPTASDPEGGVVKNVELNNGNFSRTNKKGVRWGVKLKDAVSHVDNGSLNPDWVEWMMGYGQGYTDPDNKDSFTLGSHEGFAIEPNTPRVTTENQYRKDRLKALGNSIVPQIAYHIGNAILEQEKK